MGRNSRAKKPKGGNVVMTDRQIREMKKELSDDIIRRFMLLATCAMVDELSMVKDISLPEDYMEKYVKRVERYATNLDAQLFRLRDLGESIYKLTGVDWRSW